MTPIPFDESSATRLPTSAGGSLPLLDLYNCRSLAMEIEAAPESREARRAPGQIARYCQVESGEEIAADTARIIELAQGMRAKSLAAEERGRLAGELIAYLDELIAPRIAALTPELNGGDEWDATRID